MRTAHPWRWKLLSIWIIIFTILVFWGLRTNRQAVHRLKQDKASIIQLERTNCGLRKTLTTARAARVSASEQDKSQRRKRTDLAAIKGYDEVLKFFPLDNCTTLIPSPSSRK